MNIIIIIINFKDDKTQRIRNRGDVPGGEFCKTHTRIIMIIILIYYAISVHILLCVCILCVSKTRSQDLYYTFYNVPIYIGTPR